MLYGDFDPGSGRERRARMRREVGHNRLDACQAASRSVGGVALEKTVSRKGLAARGVAVVVTLLE